MMAQLNTSVLSPSLVMISWSLLWVSQPPLCGPGQFLAQQEAVWGEAGEGKGLSPAALRWGCSVRSGSCRPHSLSLRGAGEVKRLSPVGACSVALMRRGSLGLC